MPRSTLFRSRLGLVAVSAIVATGLAGCSNSGRFHSDEYVARNSAARQDVTGSVKSRPQQTARIESQPLPAPSQPATVAASGQGSTYRPMSAAPETTGSVRSVPSSMPAAQSGGWTWEGGTPVTIAQGEDIEMLSRRYGVPQAAIMQANGFKDTAAIRPGRRIVIPRPIGGAPVVAHQPKPTPAPVVAAAVPHATHIVEPGQSLLGIAKRYGKTPDEIARANNIKPYAKLNAGDRLSIPGARQQQAVAAPQVSQPAPVPAAPKVVAATETARVAAAEPVEATATDAAKAAEPVGAIPSFRWPVKGRVIAAFGSKNNGQNNDGINLAVPEGTPIKAAEDGTVAYAGNELKGYGNLVLVRHNSGFVSAYAHASELLVKRGDTIKRGQIIARSGQTGNVTSPQLHFEIRKGSTPVDPGQYLASAN